MHNSAPEYLFGAQLPEAGDTLPIRPGLHWLRMPLPFALDHINLWLLADGDAWLAIDSGIDSPDTRTHWSRIMQQHRLCGVLATHSHPDHIGLAHWLCAQAGVPLHASAAEYAYARLLSLDAAGVSNEDLIAHFIRHGMPPQLAQQMQQRKSHYPKLVPALPHSYRRLMHGQILRIGGNDWRIICCAGHSPEHVCLYQAEMGVLIAGDMVLPRISTNVSVFALEPHGNPLQQYLDGLQCLAQLPADTLVLPSHGSPFRGLHARIAELHTHHESRLEEVLQACREKPCSAAEIVPLMFKRALDVHQLVFAYGEAIAHLNKLNVDAKLAITHGSDLIIRYQAL
ncbi:MBL fold metallo-hydrolase [Massilia sp. W12]|uniref:MBL fold metallo-hydrolase n=1 Tax=Massilia sp. W12 TaxID=3126507 RepID=UPI0030D07FD7